ncbi:ATP-binding protein [Streptomyces montanisoli]|uniref:ATP-binding protein n=1 Tax=Streptomyces montanisoli TaxID=2798581 RepID=A0A940S0D4_9ACTN|nr:ATP-binding protein [Streptomyces montanisoli]MBP0460749.1 ATP-binding protein [Streptomyces montanisoli]
MSLPMTRRIARAALLVAAGAAAPVVAAGAANAASLPGATDLGAVSSLDGANVGNTLDRGAQQATDMAGQTGSHIVGTAVPAAGRTVGSAGKTVAPAAQKVAGDTAGTAGTMLGDTAKNNQLPSLPLGG